MEPKEFFKEFSKRFTPEFIIIICLLVTLGVDLMVLSEKRSRFWIGMILLSLAFTIAWRLIEARRK
jgi:hypothetical protein